MIVKYIDRAMSKAVYDKLDDGSFSGKIPQFPGVIAFGETLYQCEQELKASLEGWLIVKLRHGDKLPVISNTTGKKQTWDQKNPYFYTTGNCPSLSFKSPSCRLAPCFWPFGTSVR